jgi:2-methylisocitrate lyase-like PEP mutase family enzyme
MCQAGLEIRTVCPLPLILDGACGWGDPMHIHRTIAMTEAAGFCAIEIEDQILPKRAHHHIRIEHMIPQELMVAKIAEAVAARATIRTSLSSAGPTRCGATFATRRCAGPRRTTAPEPTCCM